MNHPTSIRHAGADGARPRAIPWAIAAALIAAVVLPAGAEIIVRKDGQRIEGQIVSEDNAYVVIQTTLGTLKVRKGEIQSITGRRANSKAELEAQEKLAAGKLDEALASLQEALKQATDPASVKEMQALIASVNKRIEQREEERFANQLAMARSKIQQRKFAEAKAGLEKLMRENADNEAAVRMIHHQLGMLHMAEAAYFENQINYTEAAAAYERAIDQMPDNPEPSLKKAELLRLHGTRQNREDMIKAYTEGIRKSLTAGRSEQDLLKEYYELGSAYIQAGSTNEPNMQYLMDGLRALLVVMRHGAQKFPFAATRIEDGFVQLSKTQYDVAEMSRMLLDTLAVNPKAQKVRWTLAEIYWKNGQHDEAIAELKKIEEQVRASGEAPPPDFYYRLGLIYLSMPEPDYPAALAAFETESQQNKLNYMALVKAAEVHMIDGRWDTALAKADQAIGLAKEIPDAYVVKADILMRRNDPGDTVQAQYVLKVALNLKDKFHRARLKMAEIEINRQRRSEQPDYSQAIQMLLTVYMEIEKISPKVRSDEDRQSQAEAARWMAEIEWAKRNLSEAEKTLRKTIAAYPKYAEGYRLLGRLLTESDLAEYKGAKEAYLKAIELEPGHVQTYKEIGSLCDRYLRQYEEAIGYYQEYLRRKGPEKEEVERWLEESKRALAIPAALATSGTAPATTTSGTAGAPTATAAAAVTTGTAPAPATTGTIPAPAKTGAIPAPAPPRPGAPKAR